MINPFITLYVMSLDLTDRLKAVKEEKGASAVEYGLLVAGVALAVIAAVVVLKGKISSVFNSINVTGS